MNWRIESKSYDHAPKITIRPTMSWSREPSLPSPAHRLVQPAARPGGVILALKGSSAADEVTSAKRELEAAQLNAEVLGSSPSRCGARNRGPPQRGPEAWAAVAAIRTAVTTCGRLERHVCAEPQVSSILGCCGVRMAATAPA